MLIYKAYVSLPSVKFDNNVAIRMIFLLIGGVCEPGHTQNQRGNQFITKENFQEHSSLRQLYRGSISLPLPLAQALMVILWDNTPFP